MTSFKADLHIHTVLSPCADTSMTPQNIVNRALEKGLNIIGITDHNSTRQCATVKKIAEERGLFVLQGAEITSSEEVHCLTFFENELSLNNFQMYIEKHQPRLDCNFNQMKRQVEVDENNLVKREIGYYLGIALNLGMEEIEGTVHKLGGIFIPAHINRSYSSLKSQLGFIPKNINADALEIYNKSSFADFLLENPYLKEFSFVKNSDSHRIENIGNVHSVFYIEKLDFSEIKMALVKKDGRKVVIE